MFGFQWQRMYLVMCTYTLAYRLPGAVLVAIQWIVSWIMMYESLPTELSPCTACRAAVLVFLATTHAGRAHV